MQLQRVTGKRGDCAVDVVDIGKVTYVTGRNGTGKTTVLDLIRYGLGSTGRDRVPTDTEVRLQFDDASVTRSYSSMQADTKNRVSVTAVGHGTATKAGAADTIIAASIGSAWCWNAQAVLGATGPERRKAIAGVLGPALTVNAVKQAIVTAHAGRSDLPASVWPELDAALAELGRLPAEAGPEFASGWLKALRDAKNSTQARAEAARKATLTAEDRVAAAGALPGSEDAWLQTLRDLRARESELRQRAAADAPARALHTELERAVTRAREAVVEARRIDATTRARWRQDEPAMVAAAEAAVTAHHDALQRANAARAVLNAAQRTALELASAADDERLTTSATVAAGVLGTDLDLVLAATRERLVQEADRLNVTSGEADPDTFAAWGRLVALRSGAAGAAATERGATLRSTQARATATEKAWRGVDEVRARAWSDHEAAVGRLARARETFVAWEQVDHLGPLNAALDAAVARQADAPAIPPAVDLSAAIESVRSEVGEAETTLRRIQDYRAITADRDRCVTQAVELANVRNVLHEAEKRCEATVGQLYEQVLAPLVEPASRITQAVAGRSLRLHPGIGWQIELGTQVVEHLSESDAMLVGVALHAAVVLTSRSPWKALLLDGAEAFEGERRASLLRALSHEAFDNVLVAGVDDGADALFEESIKVVTVSAVLA